MTAAKPVPVPGQALSPYLIVRGAVEAILFYTRAFGAQEQFRLCEPSGKVGHAELLIGGSRIMLADESPQMGNKSPQTLGGSGTGLMLYVTDVDDTFQRAVSGGGKIVQAVKDQFYGDRSGTLADPFGHQWTIGTHIEDVAPEEMQRRMDEATKAAAR